MLNCSQLESIRRRGYVLLPNVSVMTCRRFQNSFFVLSCHTRCFPFMFICIGRFLRPSSVASFPAVIFRFFFIWALLKHDYASPFRLVYSRIEESHHWHDVDIFFDILPKCMFSVTFVIFFTRSSYVFGIFFSIHNEDFIRYLTFQVVSEFSLLF